MSQPRQQTALEEFFRWETDSWVEVISGLTSEEKAYFMPLEDLKAYWAANDCVRLNDLLTELFQPHYPPIDPELILCDHTAIFSILLRVGQGVLIEHFARYEELSDQRLPFDLEHPPRGFPVAEGDPVFLERFCQKQWMYCVPVFDDHMLHKHFGHQRLLPIVYKEPRGIDGMAGKYLITLFGSYNEMLSVGRQTSFTNPYIDTFMLKRYPTKGGEGAYKQEVNGFRGVKQSDSIKRYYGSYIHGDEYNILLEYADKGSLEDYFQNESPPSRGVDIIKFWENLFQLIKGLIVVHSVREGHYDVRPETVSVVSHGADLATEWQFKFADFGLSSDRQDRLEEGLDTYGAPECSDQPDPQEHTHSAPQISWAADVWSLGCIFSEAAVWIADGYNGLLDYRRLRIAEVSRSLFKSSDNFHDGQRVLQSVLDSHRDIEDRLRRSDFITKDVLDSMVGEMLWEEDRPNAKALLRKYEMILSRSRNKLSGDQFPRSGSNSLRSPPRLQPPNFPLPPIPRSLASIAERHYANNVDRWRSQVPDSQLSPPGSVVAGLIPRRPPIPSTVGSASDFDRELNGSTESWQIADNGAPSPPMTPFTSPHVSIYDDANRPPSHEVPPRIFRSPSNTFSDIARMKDSSAQAGSYSNYVETPDEARRKSVLGELRSVDEMTTVGRATSRASSRHSTSSYSTSARQSVHGEASPNFLRTEDPNIPVRSEKRIGKFSLFPTQAQVVKPLTPKSEPSQPLYEIVLDHTQDDVLSTVTFNLPLPDDSSAVSQPEESSSNMDFMSLNTCLEWKKAHKKVKKSSNVPPLPGAHIIEGLKGKDHAFIIDDSSSMADIWPDVKRVFEALSYVVKGMSPAGTELYFTIAYDTYRRKDTSDLVAHLKTKSPAGKTNIAHRLNLQLQGYRAKLFAAKGAKGKKAVVRPLNLYILTNGEWEGGSDPKGAIREMAKFLVAKGIEGEVAIRFISFAQSGAASQRINDVVGADYGVDIVGAESRRGNVLKMLTGPLGKANPGSSIAIASRPGSVAATVSSVPAAGNPSVSELA